LFEKSSINHNSNHAFKQAIKRTIPKKSAEKAIPMEIFLDKGGSKYSGSP
jgi:hypothetical protein